MKRAEIKARRILTELKNGKSVEEIISNNDYDGIQWHNLSNKAYQIELEEETIKRKILTQSTNVISTSDDEVQQIINLNSKLSNYALALHTFATKADLRLIENLSNDLPNKLDELIVSIEEVIFEPRLRALQKKGRYEMLPHFQQFSQLIEAATICFYRKNYIASYMTLLPVIEGVLIRWAGYNGSNKKADYDKLRNFFAKSHCRQPSPWNIVFHDIYCKVCYIIIDKHFFLPTTAGMAHNNFNRHIASHMLSNDFFATRANAMRLFLLMDLMTEIFIFESKDNDPRWNCTEESIRKEFDVYSNLHFKNDNDSPENKLLNSL